MDAQEFGRHFPELPEKATPSNLERRELLEAPRAWMSFFNDALTDYLQGYTPYDSQYVNKHAKSYVTWGVGTLDKTRRRLIQLESGGMDSNDSSETNFHFMNVPVMPLWQQLLLDGEPLTSDALTAIQVQLALDITGPMQTIRQLRNQNKRMETTRILSDALGYVAEVDSLVVGIELMKTHPELVILPAPNRFESNPGSKGENGYRNSDLIAIDTRQRQVRGIQVKSILKNVDRQQASRPQSPHDRPIKTFNDYDPEFVTIIDSVHDLDNTTLDISKVVAFPGQIALSILTEQPIKNNPTYYPDSYYMQRRQMAREIMRGRKSRVAEATRRVGERVLHDLYRDTPVHSDTI